MSNPELAMHHLAPMFEAVGWKVEGWNPDFALFDLDEKCFVETKIGFPGQMNPEIHYRVFIGRGSYLLAGGLLGPKTMIGRYCSISKNTFIGVRNHNIHHLSTGQTPCIHRTQDPFADKNDLSNLTAIGHDVWIGANATVLSGIKVGHGSIIGAGTVVTKDVPPYSIVVGNPGKIIKPRFEKRIADVLLESEWWNMTEIEIQNLPQEDIEACIEILKAK